MYALRVSPLESTAVAAAAAATYYDHVYECLRSAKELLQRVPLRPRLDVLYGRLGGGDNNAQHGAAP